MAFVLGAAEYPMFYHNYELASSLNGSLRLPLAANGGGLQFPLSISAYDTSAAPVVAPSAPAGLIALHPSSTLQSIRPSVSLSFPAMDPSQLYASPLMSSAQLPLSAVPLTPDLVVAYPNAPASSIGYTQSVECNSNADSMLSTPDSGKSKFAHQHTPVSRRGTCTSTSSHTGDSHTSADKELSPGRYSNESTESMGQSEPPTARRVLGAADAGAQCDDGHLDSGVEGDGTLECKNNVIVNYIPQHMAEDDVKAIFLPYGEVESCKLVKDKVTGQSLCYAFVKYKKADDAKRAVENLNGLRLQNKVLKVSFARQRSDSIKGANLYVAGLPRHMNPRDLERIFSQCGKIISARVLNDDQTGLSKGTGFVRFDKRIEAELAIQQLNGSIPDGATEPITVKPANQPNSAKGVMPPSLAQIYLSPNRRFIAGPLHHPSSASRLRYNPMYQASSVAGLMASAGPAFLSAAVPTELLSPASLKSFNPSPPPAVPDSPLAATLGSPAIVPPTLASSLPSIGGFNLFVYNLEPETDDRFLWQMFGPFGAVQNVKVIRDASSGKCKGYGFVTMSHYEDALHAMQNLHGMPVSGRILQVSFKSDAKAVRPRTRKN